MEGLLVGILILDIGIYGVGCFIYFCLRDIRDRLQSKDKSEDK